ncbi:vitamin D3 hydroxylase-associated protein-like isoform X1 [Pelobates fuscus]|uniref:vitamin D3 hydroxylase-associated protein-like isoform X1 n=1 Tax=Pelobates fuscus TaxID=191477 RepID=UPI002FE4BF87
MQHHKWIQSLSEYEINWKIVTSLGCLLVATVCGLKWRKKRNFLKKVEKERKRREKNVQLMQEKVNKFKKQNPGVDSRKILNLSLPELIVKLRDGSLSLESVLYSYIEKALEVDQDLNCVTDFLTDCEAQLQDLKKQENKGPLYGVPISIKEHIGYKGHPTTCGLAQYIDKLEKEDSVVVKVLKKQGAIVFAKTNVPQSLLCYDTSNPIYGVTVNPHNHAKSPGGSSGGEGALIGGGGSILGIGTDIGGSIRIPSSFCGIAGLKPTPQRVSLGEIRSCIEGFTAISVATGPMARDVDSLVLCMKTLLCDEMFKLDPTVPPLPFNDKVYTSPTPLRVGYYETDGFTLPHPGMRRAVLETKKLLEEAGHTLIRFAPPRIDFVNALFMKILFGDGGEILLEKFNHNSVDPNLSGLVSMIRTPTVVKKALYFVLKPLFPRMASSVISAIGASSVKEQWADQALLQEYQAEFIAEWRKLDLDVILCPMLGPAYNNGYAGRLLAATSYTMLFNVVQFPAGVVTVSSVTQSDEDEMKQYKGYYNDPWDKLFHQAVAGGVGLPLSVQCAALPYQDELCLRFMKEVETLHRQKKNRK